MTGTKDCMYVIMCTENKFCEKDVVLKLNVTSAQLLPKRNVAIISSFDF